MKTTSVGTFGEIEPYVARLLSPDKCRKALAFFASTRDRGFVFQNYVGELEVTFDVEWREQADLEAAIRSFFAARGIQVWRDYLAGNGDVPDATRVLAYLLKIDVAEVAALSERVLTDLCGVSPSDSIIVQYWDELPP